MAKETKAAVSAENKKDQLLQEALRAIEKEYGKGSIMRLGDRADVAVDAIPSGSPTGSPWRRYTSRRRDPRGTSRPRGPSVPLPYPFGNLHTNLGTTPKHSRAYPLDPTRSHSCNDQPASFGLRYYSPWRN